METRNLYLTSEERYEVYCVKSSERPHLLKTYNAEEASSSEEEDLALTDGCDIPNWRAKGLATCLPHYKAALNVGLGCPLLRRERQLPLPVKVASSPWETLRDFLLQQPTTATVERISCSLASQLLEEELDTNDNRCNDGAPPRKRFSKWEQDNYPVIVTDATTQPPWNLDTWRYENLVERFSNVRWRFSDTHGAMMGMDTYARYVETEGKTDDSPLAVYDSEFGNDNSPMHALVDEYQVPPCFSDDLFALASDSKCNDDATPIPGLTNDEEDSSSLDESSSDDENDGLEDAEEDLPRPPWRWILMGPPRSGTGLHIDPLWTNAWVTLLEGTKRWILIPPHVELPEGAGLQEPQVPSVLWFRDYYSQVSKLEGVVEILQRPGETVFVPNGWPHLVLNLDRTVAVTHNYASEFGPFERMWDQVLQDEPEFAQRWYKGLLKHRPDLARRIQARPKAEPCSTPCMGLG